MTLPFLALGLLLGGGALTHPAPDPALKALQADYAGKDVWVYGGGPLRCYTANGYADLTAAPTEPVRVMSVRRAGQPVARASRVLLDRKFTKALLLQVRPSAAFRPHSWAGGANSALFRPLEGPNCREFVLPFADTADIELLFSLTPPDAATRAALRPFLQADPLRPPTLRGLTHRQVLWLRGVPDEPALGFAGLLTAPEWRWLGPPGRGDNVLHFQNDRVAAEEVPSMGP